MESAAALMLNGVAQVARYGQHLYIGTGPTTTTLANARFGWATWAIGRAARRPITAAPSEILAGVVPRFSEMNLCSVTQFSGIGVRARTN